MRTDKYILDEHGDPQPCADLMQWAEWFERSRASRIVAKTRISEVEVSTVFLGLDHNYGEGPPHIYETLVFGGAHDGDGDRYATRADAIAGHAAMVQKIEGSDRQ